MQKFQLIYLVFVHVVNRCYACAKITPQKVVLHYIHEYQIKFTTYYQFPIFRLLFFFLLQGRTCKIVYLKVRKNNERYTASDLTIT